MIKYTVDYTESTGEPSFVMTDMVTHVSGGDRQHCIIHLINGAKIHAYNPLTTIRKAIEFSKQMREE